jgi:hypothetical protein
MRHLVLMPPSEIECRSGSTHKYWLRHWQSPRRSDQERNEIEKLRKKIHKARNKFRAEMRNLRANSRYDQTLYQANRRVPRYDDLSRESKQYSHPLENHAISKSLDLVMIQMGQA